MANDNTLLWVLAGGAVGVGLYFLLKGVTKPESEPGPGVTQPGALPPAQQPTAFATLSDVARALDNAKTRYRSGADTHAQALKKVSELQIAIDRLWPRVDQTQAVQLRQEIQSFQDQILEAQAMETVPA